MDDLEEDENGRVTRRVYVEEFVRDICAKWIPDPLVELPAAVDGASELSQTIQAVRILARYCWSSAQRSRKRWEDLIFFKSEGSREETLASVIDRLEQTQYVQIVIADNTPPS